MENHESEKYRKLALRVYQKLPRSRACALNESSLEGLGALAKSYADAGGSLSNMVGDDGNTGEDHFGEVLIELGTFEPSLFQPKPDEPPTLPEWPRHPLTGELMPNPFAKETESLAAQSRLMATNTPLAKAMKAAVENPWQYYFDLEEEKQKREHRTAISYTADDHARNPFVAGSLTEQSELQKRDPVRAEIFKREAQPVSLPFVPGSVNQSIRGQLYAKHPRLYQWCENARQTCEQWRAEEIAALEKEKAQAQARLEKLQKETTHKAEPIRIVAPMA